MWWLWEPQTLGVDPPLVLFAALNQSLSTRERVKNFLGVPDTVPDESLSRVAN